MKNWKKRPCGNATRPVSVVAALLAIGGSTAYAQPITITTQRIASGLNRPLYVGAAPGDTTRLFFMEKRGVIRIITLPHFAVQTTPFLDISPTAANPADRLVVNITSDGDERGLLGLAFHPNYASNGLFFVYYYNTSNQTVVARFTVSAGNPNVANPASRVQLLAQAQPETNHNGGCLAFGPDGFLYVALGDGGGACDVHGTFGNGQNRCNWLGKLLRINPSTLTPPPVPAYAIPPTNPFAPAQDPGNTTLDEIWCLGLRNPWRFSFDRMTGDLYIADVGQNAWEEIDFQPASSPGGENYGWRCREGNHNASAAAPEGSSCSATCHVDANPCSTPSSTVPTDAILEYPHTAMPPPVLPPGCSVTGGYVYRGSLLSGWQGQYIFGDYCQGRYFRFLMVGGVATGITEITSQIGTLTRLVSFGEDANGELYLVREFTVMNSPTGEIWKLVCPSSIAINQQPASQAACQGQNVSFTVNVINATGPVTYIWCKSNVPIPGAPNAPTLNLTGVQPTDAGTYNVFVADSCRSLTSSNAILTVNVPPAGDIDANCVRNAADVSLFVQVLLGLDTDPGHVGRSDLNASGGADGADIQPFVTAFIVGP